jgi:hypothetical protein
VVNGEVQAAAAPPSTEQVMLVGELVVENDTVGVVSLVDGPGAAVIVTVGGRAVGGTVKVVDELPVLPAWSVAVTRMVWLPELRPL